MISQRYFNLCPAPNVLEFLRKEPWPHLVLDDFLSDSTLDTVTQEIATQEYQFQHEERGSGRIEYALLESQTLWRAIYSAPFICLLETVFGCKVSLNKGNLLQLRKMDELTPAFPMHNDFVDGRDHVVSFLYLSGGWEPRCKGRLKLYDSEMSAEAKTAIEPIRNRLVAFHAKETYWHSVEHVDKWTRLNALAAWDVVWPDHLNLR